MILRANIRGNAPQLAWYLTALKDNSAVEILEVDGMDNASPEYLQQTILSMELNGELTKTNNAFFHVQINPAYGEDARMTPDDWHKAADILAKETGYENQRRVIVLHTKKGRIHAHVVWERYIHETGKMVDNKHSVLKADRARPKIEKALGHSETPYRNPQRPELKTALTKVWYDTDTGAEFLSAARKAGYMVAAGTGNRPFMVVDENGRAFDLVRQLEGVRTKDVRARLRQQDLVTDKQAIEIMRELQASNSGKREKQQMALKPSAKFAAENFAENRTDAIQESKEESYRRKIEPVFREFKTSGGEIAKPQPLENDQQRKETIARQFADNSLTDKQPQLEQEAELQKIIAEQERIKQRNKERKLKR